MLQAFHRVSRVGSLARIAVLVAIVAIAGCRPAAPPAAPAQTGQGLPEWDQLVAAANAEGEVSVYAFAGAQYRPVLVDAFQQAFPGIRVNATFAPATDLLNRVITERTAERYLADVFINGTGFMVQLKPMGALADVEAALVLPEVKDPNAWFEGRLWWADSERPYTTLMFQGSVQPVVSYNTTMVRPEEFNSYWDLLDPKWRGRMVATDVRGGGPGGVPSRWIYRNPELGPTFIERLFGEMDITLSTDQRQMVDWLAQGQYPIGLLLSSSNVAQAMEQGLPVALVPSERFREGAALGPGPGALKIFEPAPHPNAARVFANWLLSREGQIEWQKATRQNSLRVDIPKDGLIPGDAPRPGGRYTAAATEEYARLTWGEISGLITQALERRGR